MAESSLPPKPPKSGSGPLIGVLVAMLVVGGSFAAWRLTSKPEEPVVEVPVAQAEDDGPALRDAPPPPPPPPPLETAAPLAEQSAKSANSVGPRAASSAPAGCSGTCSGTIDASFRSALRQKAGLAKGCYDRALRQNSVLQGKMLVALRVSPYGTVCSVTTASDSLGDAAVKSCILQKFRAGAYPRPRGGCVDAQVPLNFVSKQ